MSVLALWRFTAQPTPKTRSLKRRSESGFQYAVRIFCQVGGRKSYGTTSSTRPCQVRSAGGLDNSVAMAPTTRLKATNLTRRRMPRILPILALKRSTRVTVHVFYSLFQAGEMASRLASTTRWLRWLTPGLQIKRWLLLLMVSELVLVLGVAYALKEIYQTAHLPSSFYWITLQFLPYWARAFVFGVFGVGLLLLSYLKLTQSVLGPFLPGTNTSSLVEVIHAFRLRGRGPRIVTIGGGTGLSSLLRGLKTYTSNLSAIVTVADDGGSSGRLRDEYRILSPGGFRQSLIALADAEPLMKQLFDHRFTEGSLDGHAFGNLFIMAMADITGNFEQALRESGKVLPAKGTF